MILTTCAACAAPLAHDAPRCVGCKFAKRDIATPHANTTTGAAGTSKSVRRYTAVATRNNVTPTSNVRRRSRSRSRRARTTRRAKRATSARRLSTGRLRRASCAGARAAGQRGLFTCPAWWSRRRLWSRRLRKTTGLAQSGFMRGGRGGTRAACVSNGTMASFYAPSGARPGRRT